MEFKGKIDITRPYGNNCDYIAIRLHDENAGINFCEVHIKYADFAKALTGLGHIDCDIEMRGVKNIGKKKERDEIVFEMPKEKSNDKKVATELAEKHCPEGWISSNYFGSQTSFFNKDGKYYARCSVNRWV